MAGENDMLSALALVEEAEAVGAIIMRRKKSLRSALRMSGCGSMMI